ncbi:hypothetical protein EDE11_1245 [Methylomonas methanica]|uniref:Uncharacterized protein n=1 Tax=Methylomonas methanica TaxID=421 RepID=A0ABY2CL60_METMH|nr:hypothetical protein EDE11_1245 [Methylomonas methanica]
MNNIDKLTRCANTEQTKTQKLQSHSTESAKRVKLEFIRFTAWWRMACGD